LSFIIKSKFYNFVLSHIKFWERLISPLTFFAGVYVKILLSIPPEKLLYTYNYFIRKGWLPLPFHYFQPIFKVSNLPKNYEEIESPLIGIDLDASSQLALLKNFNYNAELETIPLNKPKDYEPYYRNQNFRSGDAEILYSMIRYYKPKRIIEIGSGYSTMFMLRAIKQNEKYSGSGTELICIEPFERPWLEKLEINIIRKPVEQLDLTLFKNLSEKDFLFIDSSHVIRTHGDVVFEYLNIIPSLQKGVIVHCHDIFLPKDYPLKYISEYKYFWNEQYLLQALLSNSSKYKTLLALKYLSIHYRSCLEKCCPIFKNENEKEGPASFWFQVVG